MDAQPDFVKLAEAYGAHGFRCERREDVRATIENALATPGPVIMDFVVDREENVWPMVAPGEPIHKMMEGHQI